LNVGDLGFLQAKASFTSPLGGKVAGRLSFSGTQRNGSLFNTRTGQQVNDLDNAGVRGQLLIAPTDKIAILWSGDFSRQRPDGYTQVVAGVAPTLRPAEPPVPADCVGSRLHASQLQCLRSAHRRRTRRCVVPGSRGLGRQRRLEGRSRRADVHDRLALLELEPVERSRLHRACPSRRVGRTVEAAAVDRGSALRRDALPAVNFVAGGFVFRQDLHSDPSFKQEQGSAAARFLLAPTAAAATPGLLDGYGFNQYVTYGNTSAAVFGQLKSRWATGCG
jgi:iron complex outermembrane receptor protein